MLTPSPGERLGWYWRKKMTRKQLLVVGTLSALVAGCDALTPLLGALQPNLVTVELVNNGDFAVQGTLFYDDDQDTIEEVLVETGTERTFTLTAGGRTSFSLSCDDLQAIILDDASLQIVGDVGPEANTDVLRDGDDFGCGDTIVFTFDHSDALLDFDVSVTTRGGP